MSDPYLARIAKLALDENGIKQTFDCSGEQKNRIEIDPACKVLIIARFILLRHSIRESTPILHHTFHQPHHVIHQ